MARLERAIARLLCGGSFSYLIVGDAADERFDPFLSEWRPRRCAAL